MANMATLGPAIHCQKVTPMNSFSTIQTGGSSIPITPRALWNRPLALSNQLIASPGRMALIAPWVWNRNTKIRVTAIELVMEGK